MTWRKYVVTIWSIDLPKKSWSYILRAETAEDARIQAGMIHNREHRPTGAPERTTTKEM